MFIENKNKEKKKLTLGRIAAAPFIGTARLFTAPFVLPYKVGKNIVNAVQYAHGDPSNKRTFEEWYVIKNSNEGILQTNYRKCASIALLTLMLTCVALFFGFSFMTRADLTINLLSCSQFLATYRYESLWNPGESTSFPYGSVAFSPAWQSAKSYLFYRSISPNWG